MKTKPTAKKEPRISTSWHDWTPQQLSYLSCLKTHTTLSYVKIAAVMGESLNVKLSADILRYKCNVLKGTMPPSQEKRRVSGVGLWEGSNTWLHFKNLPTSSPEVQAILQDCGIQEHVVNSIEAASSASASQSPAQHHASVAPKRTTTSNRRPAKLSTASASKQSSASQASSPSTEASSEASPERDQPSSSARLYLPATPAKVPSSPTESLDDFVPYAWSHWETTCLCVLSVHGRLPSARIAEVLEHMCGSSADEEDVEMKIDELCGEQCGPWEEWGSKDIEGREVGYVLSRLGFELTQEDH